MTLLHIVSAEDLAAAQRRGEYRPTSLDTEGFIHLSTQEQVLFAANRFYLGQKGLVLLVIDSEKLIAPLQWDAVEGHGTFPHLYGPLNLNAITSVLPFVPEADGTFGLPEELHHAG